MRCIDFAKKAPICRFLTKLVIWCIFLSKLDLPFRGHNRTQCVRKWRIEMTQIFSYQSARNRAERRRSRIFSRNGVNSPVIRVLAFMVLIAFAVIVVGAFSAFAGSAEAQMCASSDLASVESALIEQNAKKRDAGEGRSMGAMSIAGEMCVYAENSECVHATTSQDEQYYDGGGELKQRYSTMMASRCCTTYTTSYSYSLTCSGSLWEYWYDGGTMTHAEERAGTARIIFKPRTREYVVRTAGREDIYFALVGGRYSAMTQSVPTRYDVYCPSDSRALGKLAFWEETQYSNQTERAVSTYMPPLHFGSPRTETYVSKTSNRRRHMCPEDNPCPWLVLTEGGKG